MKILLFKLQQEKIALFPHILLINSEKRGFETARSFCFYLNFFFNINLLFDAHYSMPILGDATEMPVRMASISNY